MDEMKSRRSYVACVLLAGLLAASLFAQQPSETAPARAVSAEKRKISGLPNFGQVTPTLSRGGQPSEEGFRKLKEMGVEVVVNFRDEEKEIATEKEQVEALGMRYISIAWNASRDPDDRLVAEFLELLRANAERKIFAHCHHGKERTGVMLATYRIAAQGWAVEQALDEMEAFGIRGFWFRHLKNYVRTLPERIRSDPDFRALRSTPAPAR